MEEGKNNGGLKTSGKANSPRSIGNSDANIPVEKLFPRPNTSSSSSAREPTRVEYRMRNFHHISSANAATWEGRK